MSQQDCKVLTVFIIMMRISSFTLLLFFSLLHLEAYESKSNDHKKENKRTLCNQHQRRSATRKNKEKQREIRRQNFLL